jgi:CDP-diglyceride synthetase
VPRIDRATVAAACIGAVVGVVALIPLDHVDPWSWVVAPLVLAIAAVAQLRALFASGGPFRT